MVGEILGTLAIVVATLSLFRPFHDLRRVRVAFQLIEDEFEELRAEVKSALGRAYRLRAAVQSKDLATEGEPERGETGAPGASSNGLTPHQMKINEQILARRRRL